jgi:hypothetical protein
MNTSSLYALQRDFADALFDAADDRVLEHFAGDDALVKRKRLDIYRNNVFYSLADALGDLYPVIQRLVGEDFFRATACAYLRLHPPCHAALVYLGEEFPQFLQDFEHTRQLDYLPDVAGLELAWHRAYHARDAAPLQVTDLQGLPPEELAAARVTLHPSLHLLDSVFPVFRIWQANQEDSAADETIDLRSGGEAVCACRPGYEVLLHRLGPGEFRFLHALQEDACLGEALCAAQELDPEFNSSVYLAQCLSGGFFINIERNDHA